MNKDLIYRMIESKKLKLNLWRRFSHFSLILALLVVPIVYFYNTISGYVTNTNQGDIWSNEFIYSTVYYIIPAIIFYVIQKRRLRFRVVNVDYTNEEFQEAVERTAKSLNWQIELNKNHIFRAHRPSDWTGSWGEMITIIKDKDRLLLNSICDPDRIPSVASYGWNRRNIETFLANLLDVKNGIEVREKKEGPLKVWSLKKAIIRLFAYPFCMFLIILGFYTLVSPASIKAQLAGFGAIVIASVYLFTDIKLIIIANKKANSK